MVDLPDPLYNQIDIGWARGGDGSMPGGGSYVGPSTSNYYMWWAGDSQGSSGNESTLIDSLKSSTFSGVAAATASGVLAQSSLDC